MDICSRKVDNILVKCLFDNLIFMIKPCFPVIYAGGQVFLMQFEVVIYSYRQVYLLSAVRRRDNEPGPLSRFL